MVKGLSFHTVYTASVSMTLLCAFLLQPFFHFTPVVEAQSANPSTDLTTYFNNIPVLQPFLADGYYTVGDTRTTGVAQYFTAESHPSTAANQKSALTDSTNGFNISFAVLRATAHNSTNFSQCIFHSGGWTNNLNWNTQFHNADPAFVTICMRLQGKTNTNRQRRYELGKFFTFTPGATSNSNRRTSLFAGAAVRNTGKQININLVSDATSFRQQVGGNWSDISAGDALNSRILGYFNLRRAGQNEFPRNEEGGEVSAFSAGTFQTKTQLRLTLKTTIDKDEGIHILKYTGAPGGGDPELATRGTIAGTLGPQFNIQGFHMPVFTNNSNQNDTVRPAVTWYYESNGLAGLQRAITDPGGTATPADTQTVGDLSSARQHTVYAFVRDAATGVSYTQFGTTTSNSCSRVVRQDYYGVPNVTLDFTIDEVNERVCGLAYDVVNNGGSSIQRSGQAPIVTTPAAPTLSATVPDNRGSFNRRNPTLGGDSDSNPDTLVANQWTNVDEVTITATGAGSATTVTPSFTNCSGCSLKSGSISSSSAGTVSFIVTTGSTNGSKEVSVTYTESGATSDPATFTFNLDKAAPSVAAFPDLDGLTNNNWATANITATAGNTGNTGGFSYTDTGGSGATTPGWAGSVATAADCTVARLTETVLAGFTSITPVPTENPTFRSAHRGNFPGFAITGENRNGRYYCAFATDRAGNAFARASSHPIQLDKTQPAVVLPLIGANAKGIDGSWTNEPRIQVVQQQRVTSDDTVGVLRMDC